MEKFDNPLSCREYKEYSRKWLPQDEILEAYEVDDFKIDTTKKGDTFDQLYDYVVELENYVKHLSTAANLRQKHYEKYIRNKFLEEPSHSYWRIGLNKVAEDARDKLAYWSKFKDEMFDDLVMKQDEIQKIIDSKRTWANVDHRTKNVDYNKKAKESKQV